MPTSATSLFRAIVRLRWPLFLFVAAFVVRAHWNLVAHPLDEFIYSDMRGYVVRADKLLDDPDRIRRYDAFYPWGTHVMLAGLKALFGRESWDAIGLAFAAVGATLAPTTYLIARRASRFPWVAPLSGLFIVFYYPLISLGGYVLSEIPFSACFVAAIWLLVRTLESGRVRDAAGSGLLFAAAAVFRPQALASLAGCIVFVALVRAARSRIRIPQLLGFALPMALVLGYSAHRFHQHTDRFGLISENGSLNLLFGRCHVGTVVALPNAENPRRIRFRPPAFLQMQRRHQRGEDTWIRLDAAIGETIQYHGYIGDSERHHEFIRKCVDVTGLAGQIRYGIVNAALLFHGNAAWPDSSRSQFKKMGEAWRRSTIPWFLPPLVLALWWPFTGRRPVAARILAVNLWVLLAVAGVFFGSIRIRTPYDPLLVVLIFDGWGLGLTWAGRKVRVLAGRLRGGPVGGR